MFFTYLVKELRRRSRQALVVAFGLAVAVGLVVTVTAASAGVKSAQGQVLHSLYGVGTDLTVTEPPNAGTGGPQIFNFKKQVGQGQTTTNQDRIIPALGQAAISTSQLAKIEAIPNVAGVTGSLAAQDLKFSGTLSQSAPPDNGQGSKNVQIAPGPGGGTSSSGGAVQITPTSLLGVDPAKAGIGPLSSVTITSGRAFQAADENAKVAVIDSGYAHQNNLKVGSTVTLNGTAYTVVGIATAPTGADSANIYLPLQQLQTLSSQPNSVTTLYVKATSSSQISAVQAAIEKAMPGATVTSSADLASSVTGSLNSAASLANHLGKWLAIAVLIVAFAMAALFTMSAVARRVREFGTLKALGWTSKRVVRQVMGEALVTGILGGALGVGLGYGGAALVRKFSPTLSATTPSDLHQGGPGGPVTSSGAGRGTVGKLASNAASTVSVHLGTPVVLSTILLAVALAVAGGLIAGTFGGWRAARLRPADALRKIA